MFNLPLDSPICPLATQFCSLLQTDKTRGLLASMRNKSLVSGCRQTLSRGPEALELHPLTPEAAGHQVADQRRIVDPAELGGAGDDGRRPLDS